MHIYEGVQCVCWFLAQASYLSPARFGEDLCRRDVGFFLELRPFGTWLLRTTAVLAKAFQIDAPGERQQHVGHLVSSSLAEVPSPMFIRDCDHHPTHHPTDLIGDVVGRDLFEMLFAVSGGQGRAHDAQNVVCDQPNSKGKQSGWRITEGFDFAVQRRGQFAKRALDLPT